MSSVGYLCIAILVAILADDVTNLEQKVKILEEQIEEVNKELEGQ